MKVNVLGMGWVTPAGLGSNQAEEAFQWGRGSLPPLRSRQFLNRPHKRFGRFDTYTRAGFGAIALALRSAGLQEWQEKRPIGLVVGTHHGCLDTDVAYFETAAQDGGAMASPNLFAYTLPNCMLGEASIQFGLTGPILVTNQSGDACMDGIHMALDLIEGDFCDTVVAGFCDIACALLGESSVRFSGAVFFVLNRGSETSRWQWDQGCLKHNDESMSTIGQFAESVQKRN
ncbi:MAG: beta-ketoacyl synthase [Planctomycetes bacterium]|nr:beta-ketoacyl synthase [Planctomycetota bacterium]